MTLQQIKLSERSMDQFLTLVGHDRLEQVRATSRRMLTLFRSRTLWVVNSTAAGGGVAEILHVLLPFARGLGWDVRWAVIGGDEEFFALTKRLCNGLYGEMGDGGELGPAQRTHYEQVSREATTELLALVRPGDIVMAVDPQTAGLIDPLRRAGRTVIWRCHIGRDEPNAASVRAWDFLQPYVRPANGFVFSIAKHILDGLDPARTWLVSPSIDPFSVKNMDLSPATARAILARVGLLNGDDAAGDGNINGDINHTDRPPIEVRHPVTVVRTGPPLAANAPLVVQVSRWDRLKDMLGVMTSFAQHVDSSSGAHLLLVGPEVSGVADDPEAAEIFAHCRAAWAELAASDQRRIHLACVPMVDLDENAVVINAIQRHATVVTQKSFAEGFGLTVTEAMWKARPVVAAAVGGIPSQIVHGESGLLVEDSTDLRSFGGYIATLLADPDYAGRLGAGARRRVLDNFLSDRHLLRWAEILECLLRE